MSWLSKLKPQSRKLIIMLVSVLSYIANDLAGQVISEQTMERVMFIVIAWIAGQAVADHGQQGKMKAIERGMENPGEFKNLLKGTVEKKTIFDEVGN